MQTIVSLMAGGLFLLFQAVSAWAASTTFTMSATVPDPSAISMTVSSVNSTTNAFTKEPADSTFLSFDPMTFNTTNNIYLPDHYFAIDVGVSGGAGEPDVTFNYTEGANPNGSTNGMGHKSSATFAEETVNSNGSTNETLLTSPPKTMLINVSGTHVAYTELATGAFLRVYLGVCTGNTGTDPSGCQPFSNADAAGEYTGSLLVTAVVD